MPIQITMPALSPTMEEGTLAKWLKKEGDSIKAGDVIAEIETDKATMEVEAVEEGIIGRILVQEGAEGVKVNTPIALLLEEGEDKSALDAPAAAPKAEAKPEAKPAPAAAPQAQPAPAQAPAPAGKPSAPAAGGDRIKASPLARRLAAEAGLDLGALRGSGPGGRIVKSDVEGAGKGAAPAAKAPAAAPQAPAAGGPLAKFGITADRYELRPAEGIQKVSARRLTESFRDIPHFPLTVDIEIDELLALRKEINSRAPEGVKLSVNDLLIKASALALVRVPAANASWTDEGIAWHKHADISVAVAIDGGLITPIVKDADKKGLAAISAEMKDLATRARDRKLKPEEFQGGTFSISNLGMFGIKSFASIINPPQGMILSVGAGEERPVVKNGALAKANVMTVTLTCDHRVVDGATGAKWIGVFKAYVEAPLTMLL